MKKEASEFISGIIERITYHNEENGYAILKVQTKNRRDLVTITGNVPSIAAGETIQAQGVWFNNLKYGLQFNAIFIRTVPPSSLEGIEKYLGSGLIKGIGPFFAKKLVALFKENVFDIIENFSNRLTEVEGIGKARAESICSNWSKQKVVREIMIFLQSHGVSTSRATRIFNTYGEQSIKIVSENPYQLARDIRGIGFLSADKIASNLGIEPTSMLRARAGINYVLSTALDEGHCGLPTRMLLERATTLLNIPNEILSQALSLEIHDDFLVQEVMNSETSIFLKPFHIYETYIANKLLKLSSTPPLWGSIDVNKAIDWVEQKRGIKLAEAQKKAIAQLIGSQVLVITGGPGTGKTTLLGSILRILLVKSIQIKLAAPTGRAAKRLSETTGLNAVTIHRLIKYDPSTHKFSYNADNPLQCDLLILDEASMIDTQLMYHLLRALPDTAGLILVGDVDQLPSVGPGQVLKDVIKSQAVPVVKLDHIFRQEHNSDIITSAHLVNKGCFPFTTNSKGSDFFFIEADAENIVQKIIELVKHLSKNKSPYDIQVLSPMQRGNVGCRSLNIELQKALNPSNIAIEKFGQKFAVNDKVLQMTNNYDKEVYNGDIGLIHSINNEDAELVVNFDNKFIKYSFDELDDLNVAYAVTIHKSQGSEYPCVIVPISTQHFPMLQRNLLYTAITRGRKRVFLIGQKKAVAIAVKNNKENERYARLRELLVARVSCRCS